MSSTNSTDALVASFDGASPTAYTTRWSHAPAEGRRDEEDLVRLFTIQWTAPMLQHELRIVPNQGTGTTPADVRDALVRIVCHWMIDHLPRHAHAELVSALYEMFDFYRHHPAHAAALLPAGAKAFRAVTRVKRPEVILPDEE